MIMVDLMMPGGGGRAVVTGVRAQGDRIPIVVSSGYSEDAIGADLGDWVKERIPEDTGGMFLLTYGDLMERLSLLYMEALRDDPLVCKIIAWEVSKDTPQVRRLAEARSRALAKWLDRMRGSLSAPKGVDAPTANGILFAAIQHLVISSRATGEFAGLPLRSEKDWDKVAASIRRLVRGIYG